MSYIGEMRKFIGHAPMLSAGATGEGFHTLPKIMGNNAFKICSKRQGCRCLHS
jgi:hypothetical protein